MGISQWEYRVDEDGFFVQYKTPDMVTYYFSPCFFFSLSLNLMLTFIFILSQSPTLFTLASDGFYFLQSKVTRAHDIS